MIGHVYQKCLWQASHSHLQQLQHVTQEIFDYIESIAGTAVSAHCPTSMSAHQIVVQKPHQA